LAFLLTLTVIVSTGSATGCLTFFWAMRRAMRVQKITLPHNTFVWMVYYALLMGGQIVTWMLLLLVDALALSASAFATCINIAVDTFSVAITVWCAVRLRALPKDVPSATLNEQS
jgi:diacylglycerol kinase